jgi:hypothetical protein
MTELAQNNVINYRQLDGVNQSLLKRLESGPFYLEQDSSADHLVLGQLVEDLFMGSDTQQYLILDLPSKATNLGKFLAEITQHWQEANKYPDDSVKQAIYTRLGMKSPKFEVLLGSAEEHFSLIDKEINWDETIVLNRALWDKADRMVSKLKACPLVTELLREDDINRIVMKKVPLQWAQEFMYTFDQGQMSVEAKGELDYMLIDHEKKVISFVDLKTSGQSIYYFKSSFRKFRYDIQAAYYYLGLAAFVNKEYPGYALGEVKYLAVDDYTPRPLIHTISSETLDKGIHGYVNPWGDRVPGINELLSLYLYYEKNGYEYPAEVQQTGSILI